EDRGHGFSVLGKFLRVEVDGIFVANLPLNFVSSAGAEVRYDGTVSIPVLPSFSGTGNHSVVLRGTDWCGNQANFAFHPFVADSNLPKIQYFEDRTSVAPSNPTAPLPADPT